MKTRSFVLVLVSAIAVLAGTVGCVNHSTRRFDRDAPRQPTFALAITVNGNAPTPLQFEAVLGQMRPLFENRGWLLVSDPDEAERIVRVDFVPNPVDPENMGQTFVLGIIPNPTRRRAVVVNMPVYYSSRFDYADYYYSGDLNYWSNYGYRHHGGHWSAPGQSSSGGAPAGDTGATPTNPAPVAATDRPRTSSGQYSPPDDQPRIPHNKWNTARHAPVSRVPRDDPPSRSSSSDSSTSYASGSSRSSDSGSSYSSSSSSSDSAPSSSYSPPPSSSSSDTSSPSTTSHSGNDQSEKLK